MMWPNMGGDIQRKQYSRSLQMPELPHLKTEFVHVAWQDTSGNDEILYARSTNGGTTFTASN